MEELNVDLTYGTALFQVAEETGKIEMINREAAEIAEIFQREEDLHDFVNAPGIPAAEKKQVMENIFGGRICEELLSFLCILIDKGRIIRLKNILKAYVKLTEEKKGLSYGTVYSVIPLDDERIREMEEQTSKLLRANVKLNNEIDPKLIGGVRILVEDKMIDASVRKRFDDLNSQINSN